MTPIAENRVHLFFENDPIDLFNHTSMNPDLSGQAPPVESSFFNDFEIEFDELESIYNVQNENVMIKDFKEVDNFLNILNDISKSEDSISIISVQKAEDLWYSLLNEYNFYIEKEPLISSNEDGEILISFDLNSKYLGIRICEDLTIEVFAKNFEENTKSFDQHYFTEEVLGSDSVRNFFTN